jgi:hypothetical protein
MRRTALLVLAVVGLFSAAAAQVQQEVEPNDGFKQATGLVWNVPVTCSASREFDRDYFVITVPAPGADIMVIEVSGIPDATMHLFLLDPAGKTLDQNADFIPGRAMEICRMKVKPGTYYLEIDPPPKNKVGSEYTIRIGAPRKPPASPEEVRQALVKALDWLVAHQKKDGSWAGHEVAYAGLSAMAFIGSKCTQKDYVAPIAAAVGYVRSTWKPSEKFPAGSKEAATEGGRLGSGSMYEQAIAALSLIEALVDQNDASLEPIVRDVIELILRSQNVEGKPETLKGPVKPDSNFYGGWRYNPYSTDSDLSVTAWQVLTLRAAVNAGFSVPDDAFLAAAKYVRSLHGKDDGSFEYQNPGTAGNSCARAGMGALALQLCGSPQDPAIAPALRFMQDHAPRWNNEVPGNGYPFYYWYYGTRAMYVAGGDDWRIWKDWMCRFLVDHQNGDGGWDGMKAEQDLDVYRTALGALMLEFCCGHVPIYLAPVKRSVSGPGTLKVDLEKGATQEAAKTVEIIMDASNSMTGLIGKETKIAAARRVLIQTIKGLPDTMSVGFRVYGHRYATDDYDNACRDTELLAPIGPVDKAALVGLVNTIQTKGRTPLVKSVLAAVKDFEKIANGSIILVTDGIESCQGDIKSIAPAIQAAGLAIEVNIVGFDIKEAAARQELQSIAASTGGRYLDAKDADELLKALETTLKLEFVVLDGAGKEAGRGIAGGEPIKLSPGAYTVRALVGPKPVEIKVTVKPGGRSALTLKKSGGGWEFVRVGPQQ